MSIQFACPSCAQPIEVDSVHAGRNALCPYCRREVVVPAESTYSPAQITARPAGSPPPAGPSWEPSAQRRSDRSSAELHRSNPYATWALVMSIGALCSFAFLMVSAVRLILPLAPAPGSSLTPEDSARIQKALEELAPREPGIVIPALLIPALAIGGLALAIAALRRGNGGWKAWFSLIVCGAGASCVAFNLVSLLGRGAG